MRKKVKALTSNRLVRGSAVLWIGMMAANVSNYFFHLLMGRFLGPVNYGVLASIFSVLYYLFVPISTITTTVMKYTAEYDAEGVPGKINTLFIRLTKQLLVVGMGLFVVIAIASPLISRFLKIDSVWPMLILSIIMPVGYVVPVNIGILQGLKKFGFLSINMTLQAILKLSIGIALVLSGFSVNGALLGVVLATYFGYAFSFIPLRKVLRNRERASVSVRAIWKYSVPVFITLLCLNSYYSADIILVKHFLSPVEAGHYAGLSILGKIVVFASLAIVGVMFPMVAGRHKVDQKHSHLLGYTLGLITTISGSIVLAYSVAPKFIINLLFGTKYLAVAPYLGWFGLAMLFLALSSALSNYYLAIDKTKCVIILVGAAIIQIASLWAFHSSLSQIVDVMVGTMALLFIYLSAFYFVAVRGASRKEPDEPPLVPLPTEF